jgi:hypothetical protein
VRRLGLLVIVLLLLHPVAFAGTAFPPSKFTVEKGSFQAGTVANLTSDNSAYVVINSVAPRGVHRVIVYVTFANIFTDNIDTAIEYDAKTGDDQVCDMTTDVYIWRTRRFVNWGGFVEEIDDTEPSFTVDPQTGMKDKYVRNDRVRFAFKCVSESPFQLSLDETTFFG